MTEANGHEDVVTMLRLAVQQLTESHARARGVIAQIHDASRTLQAAMEKLELLRIPLLPASRVVTLWSEAFGVSMAFYSFTSQMREAEDIVADVIAGLREIDEDGKTSA
jgi:hypothetical protein